MSKRIIEINGRKFEVNEADLKIVEGYKVGDTVKILKKTYSDNWESHFGAIIGYDNYQNLPTIRIMYLDVDYSETHIRFVTFNSKTEDVELAPLNEADLIQLDKARIVDMLNSQIEKKKQELEDAKAKKDYFLKYFNAYFKASGKVDKLLK
jgi:nicotinic acid mononucleotide adenylyltransferase